MRRVLLLGLTACRFEPGSLAGDSAVVDVAQLDAPLDVAVAAYCDPTNIDLVACYQFEGNANDASSHQLHAVTADTSFPPGRVGLAMELGTSGAADVAESAALDMPFLTIEAWIKPTTLPGTGLRMGILDNNGQYGFFLYEGGNLRCSASNVAAQTSGTVTAGEWHHVACTHDGSTTIVYLDGASVAQVTGGTALGTAGTTGLSLAADNPPGAGSRLVGLIDELRIFSVARTAAEICEDAGTCEP